MTDQSNAIIRAMSENPEAAKQYPVQSRGRPEREPDEAAKTILRREAFGRQLRIMRQEAGLTLQEAANASGMNSARKLAQYEITCYPPGDVVRKLAPIYGVCEKYLGWLLLRHSDPDIFTCLTGQQGYQPDPYLVEQKKHEELLRKSETKGKSKR